MLNVIWLDPGSLDRLADNGGAQFGRWLVFQASAIVSNGSAHAT